MDKCGLLCPAFAARLAARIGWVSHPVMTHKPIRSAEVPARRGATIYPQPFASLVAGRTKRKLGDIFELTRFGVNLTELEPGAVSALPHHHREQDEFVYILEGHATVVVADEEYDMEAGDCIGFKGGTAIAHQLINRSEDRVVYLEVGDRTAGDSVEYPHDDIAAKLDKNGVWVFSRKDGTRY